MEQDIISDPPEKTQYLSHFSILGYSQSVDTTKIEPAVQVLSPSKSKNYLQKSLIYIFGALAPGFERVVARKDLTFNVSSIVLNVMNNISAQLANNWTQWLKPHKFLEEEL